MIEPINYIVVTFNPWLQNKLKDSSSSFEINVFFKKILLPLSFLISIMYVVFGKKMAKQEQENHFLHALHNHLKKTSLLIINNGFWPWAKSKTLIIKRQNYEKFSTN